MIRYKTLDNFSADQPLPSRGTAASAGIDLSAAEPVIIRPGESVWVRTGVAFRLSRGLFATVRSRSSLRKDYRISAFHGTIDPDYRGEIMINLMRDWCEAPGVEIPIGRRIAQLVVMPYSGWSEDLKCVDELDATERGSGGFGSTGE